MYLTWTVLKLAKALFHPLSAPEANSNGVLYDCEVPSLPTHVRTHLAPSIPIRKHAYDENLTNAPQTHMKVPWSLSDARNLFSNVFSHRVSTIDSLLSHLLLHPVSPPILGFILMPAADARCRPRATFPTSLRTRDIQCVWLSTTSIQYTMQNDKFKRPFWY